MAWSLPIISPLGIRKWHTVQFEKELPLHILTINNEIILSLFYSRPLGHFIIDAVLQNKMVAHNETRWYMDKLVKHEIEEMLDYGLHWNEFLETRRALRRLKEEVEQYGAEEAGVLGLRTRWDC
jgi:hypothetical protein